MKRYEDAKTILRKGNATVEQLTYFAYEKNKNFEVAKAIMEVAEEKFPQSSMVIANFAKLYLLHGNKKKALEYGEKALKMEPSNREIRDAVEALRKGPELRN
jgi:tetratricopeptide (TPR) repeat protein